MTDAHTALQLRVGVCVAGVVAAAGGIVAVLGCGGLEFGLRVLG